jgi:DNA-binding NarL/FixJ family response regulator
MKIRVLIGDDHKIVRQGLRSLLEKQPDIEVIAEAEDGRTAVRLAQEMMPNVVVMDVAMPDLNGIEATHQILTNAPDTKVIALSMYSDKRVILNMLRAGASGYLPKDCAFEELVQAIRAVAANKTYLSPTIVDVMVKNYFHRLEKVNSTAFSILSHRECEVLQLLAEGKSIKEVAHYLSVSIRTIETHRQQIMKKLNIHSIAELTKYAIREGLTSLDINSRSK